VKGARRKGDYSTEPRHRGTSSGPDVCAQACDVLVVGGGVNGAGIAQDATSQASRRCYASSATLRRIHRRAGLWPSAAFESEQDVPLF
jgi:hypothetical protein